MPEKRFTKFPALSTDLRVGNSLSASETDDRLFFKPNTEKIVVFITILLLFPLFLALYNGQL